MVENLFERAQEQGGFLYKSSLTEEEEKFCRDNDILVIEDENKKSSNIFKLYLQEIGSYPMLTPEEERELGYALLTDQKEAAKEKLINANLRLVVSIAKKYFYKTPVSNLDIIQMGNMGLMTAADKYDVTKGNKFATFATYWIRQAILRGLSEQSRNIRLPENIISKLNYVNKCKKDFEQENGESPTIDELASLTGYNSAEVKLLLDHSLTPLSLSQRVSDDTDDSLEDLCADTSIRTPEQAFAQTANKELVDKMLSTLGDEREIAIVRQRFGLDDGQEKTWAEIGKNVGLSHTRVEQLFKKALKKLSSPSRKKIFADQFYDLTM